MRVLVAALLLVAGGANAQVEIDQPWARATAPGAQVAGGYMTIRNKGAAADRLIGGSTPVAARIELHVHIKDGEVVKMRQVQGYDVPAKGSFELKPGGAHLMFLNITRPFTEGERIPVRLKFEKAGELSVEFNVGRLGQSTPPARRH